MANLLIELDIPEINLNTYSSFAKHEDDPIKREKVILITGKPIYSSTSAIPEVIDFTSEDKRIELPEIISIRTTQEIEKQKIVGKLNYITEFSDDQLGIDKPPQFEALTPYPINEFNDAWK